MKRHRYFRNGTAFVFFVLAALYLDSAAVQAAGCSGPQYNQDGVICEEHYACDWYVDGGEDWEDIANTPYCSAFYWTGFDLWLSANFSTQSWIYGFQCYDICPPYFGDCGTYGSVNVVKYYEGTCPG